jgi:transposase-like protein
MAIVWPCPLSVESYAAAGREIEVPRPDCPQCGSSMTFWSGYWRYIREAGRCRELFVRRARCHRCQATHVLLPGFVIVGRLDVAETIGAVIEEVIAGPSGVRPAAERRYVPHETARGWLRRFTARAKELAVSFAALSVELGGDAIVPDDDAASFALSAILAAFRAATALPGWALIGVWRFASSVSGGGSGDADRSPLQQGGRQ